jgi:hypothetical protein
MTLVLNGTNGLSDVDGSAATPAIRGTDANTGIFFPAADTIAFAEGGVESARIDSAGNVGIGTSSPTARLHVNTGATSNTMARFTSNGSYSTYILTSGVTSVFSADTDGTNCVQIRGGSNQIECYTNGAERARIDSSGRLLVGTTSTSFSTAGVQIYPTGEIDAVASAQATLFLNRLTSDGNIANFYRSGTQVGSISVTGSATSYVTSSDYRLKENVQPMTGALSKVAALKPCTYKWKADDTQSQGFIAHELQEVVPECVTGEKDAVDANGNPVYQGIDTSFLVATLTAAIQEMKAIIDTQASTITTLTDRITALEAKL